MSKEPYQYKNPPIAEALCEFRFEPSEFDFSFPTRFYELINSDYPAKPTARHEQSPLQDGGTQTTTKLQFSAEERRRLVVTGANTLSIHDMTPYVGWTKFKERISKAYNAYQSLMNSPVVGINVRYLNAIDLPLTSSLRDYFTFVPPKLLGVPDQASAFYATIQLEYPEDEPYVALVSFSTHGAQDGKWTLLLDVNCVWISQSTPLVDFTYESKIATVVEELRDRERAIFEGLISDKLREMLNE